MNLPDMESMDKFMGLLCIEVGEETALIALLTAAFPKPGLRLTATRSGQSGPGLLVLLGVRPADDEAEALKLLARLLQYRVFRG